MSRPLIIGLIGGVASGKSTVARLLESHGGLWLDADRLAHEILNQPDVIGQLQHRWGAQLINENGTVNRSAVARSVFGDSPKARSDKQWLEQLIHPRVRQLIDQRIAVDGANYRVVIIDAPLLLEAGWGSRCDRILLVDSPVERRETLAALRGWSHEELARRESAQLSLAEKRKQATDVVVNDGTLEELAARVRHFWDGLALEPSV